MFSFFEGKAKYDTKSKDIRSMIFNVLAVGIWMNIQGLLPFIMYDLPFQRRMDVDDLILHDDTKTRSVNRYRQIDVIPYRDLSAAYTVMLQLCKPEVRDFHRSK